MLGSTERVHELLDENPEVDCQAAPAAKEAARLRGDVHFEGVSFRYPSRRQTAVLRGLTLHANAGERKSRWWVPAEQENLPSFRCCFDFTNPTLGT